MKKQVFKMYEDISIGINEVCTKCKEFDKLEKPLSLYYVGANFKVGADTVLFVGKTAVGGENFEVAYQGDYKNDRFTDATKFGEKSLDLTEPNATGRAFYNYTHSIIEEYYGSYEKGKSNVALTNLVKCNNTSTEDTVRYEVKECCIEELRVFWKEFEILSPKRVVFYTHDKYNKYIEAFMPKGCVSVEDVKKERVQIGKKDTPWWHRRYLDNQNRVICDFLILGHPQMMDKEEYVGKVAKWLNVTK